MREEVYRVADRMQLQVHVVSNGSRPIPPARRAHVQMVTVDEGADKADDWIAERAGKGDIVVTGDIPLAAKCVASGARVLKHNGEALTEANIGQVLGMRDLMADLRAADPFRQGGGKAFGKADRSRFLDALEREVQRAKRGG